MSRCTEVCALEQGKNPIEQSTTKEHCSLGKGQAHTSGVSASSVSSFWCCRRLVSQSKHLNRRVRRDSTRSRQSMRRARVHPKDSSLVEVQYGQRSTPPSDSGSHTLTACKQKPDPSGSSMLAQGSGGSKRILPSSRMSEKGSTCLPLRSVYFFFEASSCALTLFTKPIWGESGATSSSLPSSSSPSSSPSDGARSSSGASRRRRK